MFYAFELRFVVIMLVVISQAILSLLSAANVIVAGLKGSYATVPIFVIATNGLLSLATVVIVVLDYIQRSPLGVLSEMVLCAAAGGVDLLAAIAMLLFKMDNTICGVRSGNGSWNTCGAHFAITVLLWTAAALLFAYAIVLLYVAKQYQAVHPSERGSIWKQTVRETRWPQQTYTIDSPPGRRLRKKAPLDIESLRRAIPDKDSVTSSRDVLSSPLPGTPSRSVSRPPGLNSPTIGFAERMGYLRRDAMGEYVPSTPTHPRGFQPGNPYRGAPEGIGRDAVFRPQAPTNYRRPSFPDLPNPFPSQPALGSPMRFPQQVVNSMPRSRTPSNSSGGSSSSSPGFAGLGAGVGPQKDTLRISIPMPVMPIHGHGYGPASAKSAKTPRSSMPPGGGQQRPFRVSVPTTPTNARSPAPPRLSLQSSRSSATSIYPHIRPPGARPAYNISHQHTTPPSLIPVASLVSTPEVGYGPNPLVSQLRPRAGSTSSLLSQTPSPFLPVPSPAMSPSTKQRVSNQAYPLPLPPLSTYPIKSVAMSIGSETKPSQVRAIPGTMVAVSNAGHGQSMKDRPLSTVSTVSIYSTSSASHGPPPSQEHLLATSVSLLSMGISTESGTTGDTVQRSDSTSSRRSLKSKKAPILTRVPSHHGAPSHNLWGGTGKGPARRSLAAQFQQPQARAAL